MAKPTDKCSRCKKKFKLTADNTVAYLFLNRGCEDFSYFTAVCPHCEVKNWTFCYNYLKELAEIIRQTQCEVVTEQYPDEQILLDWCKVYGVERPAERELTSTEEHEIEFFAWLLGADPKYIWQEFE